METKYYYSYNTTNHIFAGKYPAIKNPRRPSEYLLPAMATFKEPPVTKENEVAIWNGKDWAIELNFQGNLQVNVETKEISQVDYIGKIKSGFQLVSKETAEDIQINPTKYKNINGILSDISDTEEYKQYLYQLEITKKKFEIEQKLQEIDTKRIRAICEPAVKDEATGETWLDFYNKQIQTLRDELSKL